jgi:hypothetical protein
MATFVPVVLRAVDLGPAFKKANPILQASYLAKRNFSLLGGFPE